MRVSSEAFYKIEINSAINHKIPQNIVLPIVRLI